MPVVLCPHCDLRQSVSKDLAGLSARCSGCSEGMQIPLAAPKPARPAVAPTYEVAEPERDGDLRKTVLLLGGLIVGVLVVLGVLLYAVSPSKKHEAAPTAAKSPAVTLPLTERDATAGNVVAGLLGVGYLLVVFVTLLVIVYAVGVFVAGVALAKDAAARGLPTLPWAGAFFGFQAVGPWLGALVATPLLAAFPPLGVLAGVALGLLASWYGGLVYLAVRRPGRKLPCPRCRNPRLGYLVTCPHCGQTEPAGSPG